ncbi:MAG: carbohydrate binding domain-containing protein [Rubrivivax sp.]
MRMTLSACASALVASGLWLALPATVQAQNLIVNGGFESGTLGSWSTAGDAAFIGVAIDIGHTGSWAAFAGPDPSGSLLQTVNTTPGLAYVVSFWLRLDDSAQPNSFSWNWGNSTPAQPFNNVAAFDYTRFSTTVVATTASSTLRFNFVNPQSFWLLDDVSVTVVPEPAAAALLAAGLLALTMLAPAGLRRRQSTADTAAC